MEQEQTLPTTENNEQKTRTDIVWIASCAGITAVASFLRFFWLTLKPLHHDEGVNGYFLTNLLRDNSYKYDPANYHGPTLYYIALPFVKLFGLETFPIRASVAIFGVATVVLAFFLRRYIGRVASLFAALFIALSPGMVYVSRYFIHEIFFVFLSLAVVVAVLFFIEKRKPGYFAVGWMVLLLIVCFLPSALDLATAIGGENNMAVWAFRGAFFLLDGVLVYFVLRMLLTWDEGRPIYLLLASASVALMFATKETAFITLGTMAIACGCVWMWRGIRENEAFDKNVVKVVAALCVMAMLVAAFYSNKVIDGGKWLHDNFLGIGKVPEPFVFYSIIFLAIAALAAWIIFLVFIRTATTEGERDNNALTWTGFRNALGEKGDLWISIAGAAAIFIYLSVLLFSSYFTYADGVPKAIEAYAIWTKTGSKDHTQNGIFAYLKWGMKVESAILILSALGALIALLKGRNRFAIFTAFWAFGLFAAYTIIPYKTPWLALSYLLPMCIIAGYGIGEMLRSAQMPLKIVGIILALSGTSLLAYQTYDLNFVRYDDEEMGYVYAHTKRGFLDMIREIEHYADKSGKGKEATIEIVSPDYWPMTWYMTKYSHANFHGSLVDANTAEMIVAKKDAQDAEVIRRYSAHYKYVGLWPLRPGVDLMLLVRKDMADGDALELYKIPEQKGSP